MLKPSQPACVSAALFLPHARGRHAAAHAGQARVAAAELVLEDYSPGQLAGIVNSGAATVSEAPRLAPDLQEACAGAQQNAIVARLPRPAVPGYHELGVRIARQARRRAELARAGWNLLQARHPEPGAAGPRQLAERHALAGTTLCI